MKKLIKNWGMPVMVLAALFTCLAWSKYPRQTSRPTVVVDFGLPASSVKSMAGFLLSFNDISPAQNLIDEVAPKTWRIGDGLALAPKTRFSDMKRVRNNSLTPIVIISDFLGNYPVGQAAWIPTNQNPKQYLDVIGTIYNRYGNNVIYDLWNEPNYPIFWRGTENDFFATFKLAHDKLRSLPGGDKAIISGPSINKFDKAYIERFLIFCVNNNIKLDVLSWHDFRTGSGLLQLKNDLQWAQENFVKKYPSLGIKKIQLNEIIGPTEQYSPLVPLIYFKELEDGGADASCKACWPNSKGISNCKNNSLDGLINENGEPRSVWWAYKYYGESTQQRLTSMSSSENLMTFAYQSPNDTHQVRILLANYKNDLPSLTINLKQLTSMAAFKGKKNLVVEYYQIQDTGENVSKGPQLIGTKNVNIASLTTASFSLNNLNKNEVYLLEIK